MLLARTWLYIAGMTIVYWRQSYLYSRAWYCALGIGTSEVEMVLASLVYYQPKPKRMRITVNGNTLKIHSKDIILYSIISWLAGGATGYFTLNSGSTIGVTEHGRKDDNM